MDSASSRERARTHCTLLQLVSYFTSLGASERQTIDTVSELIRSGRVRLTGNFRERSLLNPPGLDPRH